MGTALLVEFFSQLPEPKEGDTSRKPSSRLRTALNTFKKQAARRYTEGTLQRLLGCEHVPARRAAVLALGMLGTMDSNPLIAARLHDGDAMVRQLATEALWSLWFRADSEDNNRELQRLLRLRDPEAALAGLSALLKRAPLFAEAYNQRAILYFRLKEFQKAIADCERTLKLNPHHFGAQGGMAQCYMNLHKPRPALRAFRNAYRINPDLEGVEETIRALETSLGEEGRRDDKK